MYLFIYLIRMYIQNGTIHPIEKFTLNLHGIRVSNICYNLYEINSYLWDISTQFEQVNSRIMLEQSRSDRSKNRYIPDV